MQIYEDIMVRGGIMNLLTGIWVDIKEIIKGENKMEKKQIKNTW